MFERLWNNLGAPPAACWGGGRELHVLQVSSGRAGSPRHVMDRLHLGAWLSGPLASPLLLSSHLLNRLPFEYQHATGGPAGESKGRRRGRRGLERR